MLTYYLGYTNNYTIRTQDTASSQYTMSLQDMYTLTNATMSITSASFIAYENAFEFTGSISGAYAGAEYRATLYSSGSSEPIWHGSFQVFQSQSVDKTTYETQITQYVSHESTNEYDQYIIQ